jgi:hypothetical protein
MKVEEEEEEEAVAPTEGVGEPGATGATAVFPSSSKMQTSQKNRKKQNFLPELWTSCCCCCWYLMPAFRSLSSTRDPV